MDHFPLPNDNQIEESLLEELKSLPPLNIHRLLCWLPGCRNAWVDMVKEIYKIDFDPVLREVIICRYGFKTNSAYEMHQHKALARAKGVSDDIINVITTNESVTSLSNEINFLCKLVDEFEDNAGKLSDSTFNEFRNRYDIKTAMLILMILGHYSCVTRVLNATRIPLEKVSPLEGASSPTKKF